MEPRTGVSEARAWLVRLRFLWKSGRTARHEEELQDKLAQIGARVYLLALAVIFVLTMVASSRPDAAEALGGGSAELALLAGFVWWCLRSAGRGMAVLVSSLVFLGCLLTAILLSAGRIL